MNKIFAALPALALAAIAAPALAADLPAAPAAPAAVPAVPAAAPTTTIGLEFSPEVVWNPASSNVGKVTDYYVKGTVSETVAPGWTVSGFLQGTEKVLNDPVTYQGQAEIDGAYKAKLNSDFSVTITGGIGYTWGDTGYFSPTDPGTLGTDPFFYYMVQGALDWKLDSHWTWNVVQARYRNAFDRTWVTPKVQTGITYAIDANNSIYGNVGFAWKDQGDGKGLLQDKWNVAVGYKYSF